MTPMKELTLRAVVVGLVLSVVMGAANVYLGLKAGMTVSASIPAAVLAMLILRGLFRGGTILEANQVQTTASAGESLAAGIIFTMPALVLIGAWQRFDLVMTTVIAFSGGLLGVLFMIPMRRVFVVKPSSELKFPEGVACASVLKAGDTAGAEASNVIWGAVIGAVFKSLVTFFGVIRGILEGAVQGLGGRLFYFGGDISPALVAVGYIVRLNIASQIFMGGAISWIIGIPLLSAQSPVGDPLGAVGAFWGSEIRYAGVGAMVVGGIASLFKVRHGLLEAVREIARRRAVPDDSDLARQDRDISSKAIVALSVMAVLLIGIIYYVLTGNPLITLTTTVIMVLMAFFFTAVASYIVGLVGNSNSPVSGMTITAVLFTGGLLLFGFSGMEGMEGMVATLGVAAIVCCAACTSGDVCNDLKTGSLVGASPFRQQTMQVAGVAAASLVMAPVLQLLHDNTPGGIGGRELSAPQATLFKGLVEGLFGQGDLPWDMVGIGVGVGLAILVIDGILQHRGSSFRMFVMPVAVGMYLPLGLETPILIGGLLAYMASRGEKEVSERRLHRGVLYASGLIAGESLTGVGIALLASLGIARLELGGPGALTTLLTVAGAVAILASFRFFSRPRS